MAPSPAPAPFPSPLPPPPHPGKALAAGYLLAASIGIVVLICLLRLLWRRRSKAVKQQIEVRKFESCYTRGIKRPGTAESSLPLTSTSDPPSFSRFRMIPKIVIPKKCVPRSDRNAAVLLPLEYPPVSPGMSDTLAPQNDLPRLRVSSILGSSRSRHSRSSSGFSAYSNNTIVFESDSPQSPVTPISRSKTVRRLFEPVLPDELAVFRVGERLTVLQSFNDGWYLVARDTSRFSRLSWLSARKGDHVDVGVVPKWVFIGPGGNKEPPRPFRGDSIHALSWGQNSKHTRSSVTTWSLF